MCKIIYVLGNVLMLASLDASLHKCGPWQRLRRGRAHGRGNTARSRGSTGLPGGH